MLIGKQWKIESDSLNYILYKRRVVKETGVEMWDVIGYYAFARNALKELVDMEVRGTGLEDFQKVVKKIAELKKLINELEIPHKAASA